MKKHESDSDYNDFAKEKPFVSNILQPFHLEPFLTAAEIQALRKNGRKETFYLTTHSTHFYLRLYGVRHMVKDHSDSEKGNPLPPHRLLFPISSKGSFICTIPQTG